MPNRDIRPFAYSDAQFMHAQKRVEQSHRTLPTPEWALNDALLRERVLIFLERRAHGGRTGGRRKAGKISEGGTPQERLARAEGRLKQQASELRTIEAKLSERYNILKKRPLSKYNWSRWFRRKRLPTLEINIKNCRKQLLLIDRPGGVASVILSIAYLYWRMGWDSVHVGRELNLDPRHVRMVLYRLVHSKASNSSW